MKKEVGFVLAFVVMIVSFFFDREILNAVFGLRNGGLDTVMVWLSHAVLLVVVLFLCSYLLWDKIKIAYLWGGVGFSYVVSLILKALIKRVRPLGSGLETFSFPSSHATVYFFVFIFMAAYFEKYRWWFLALAVLVSVSRLYLGKHYLSDVIGGGLLGIGLYLLLKRWIKT
jgi:undecaprenyl-diphosphatase